jgi:protocatechuate 3,4-dioxygenase beta subunit
MNNLTRLAVIMALGSLCAPALVLGQVTPAQPAARKVTGSTVTGRITLQGKGKAGIVVGVRSSNFGPQMGPPYKGISDSDGNYRITDIPPGSYQVLPLAPAYVISEATAFGPPGKSLFLTEGEKVDSIDFAIVRGAVITGKVTQTDGKPVIDERVYVMDADPDSQRGPRYATSTPFQTDDRGIYRIYGLAAGKYKVSIGAGEDSFTPNRARSTYPRVFYTGVASTEPKVVELDEGAEATNIDITVGPSLENFVASGTILDGETNLPVPNVRFGLQRVVGTNNTPFFGTSTTSNAKGEFRIDNLTPGKYSIFVMPDQNTEIRTDPVRFEVLDQNVSGILLKTARSAAISGVIVVEGNPDRTVYDKLTKLRISTYVRTANQNEEVNIGRSSAIGADGGFRFGGLQAGFASFQLVGADFRTNPGFVISRIERDGVVQQRPGIDVKIGDQVSGLRIVVTYGTGGIRGTVKWDGGAPPSGLRAVVRISKAGENFSTMRPQEVDVRGHFAFESLPAGTYELNLNAYGPAAPSRMAPVKQTVNVTDGAVAEVEMLVDTKPNVPPNQ